MATKKKMKDGDKKFSIGLSGGGQANRKGAGGSVGGSASFNVKNGVRATVSGGGGGYKPAGKKPMGGGSLNFEVGKTFNLSKKPKSRKPKNPF